MIPHYLECSQAYRDMEDEDRDADCRCGTDKTPFVPQTIYGLSVKPACCIHDYDYLHGKDERDRNRADHRFLRNMLEIINRATGWHNSLLRMPRRRRALKYYEAVNRFGAGPFWQGKTNPADPAVHIS